MMLKIANQTHYHKLAARELVERVRNYRVEQDFQLRIEDTLVTICCEINRQKACFSHSFLNPELLKRASQKNQSLLKACNNKKRDIKTVIDLTAGWGKDSFILATHGQSITMIEQDLLIYSCLDYLLYISRKESDNSLYQRLSIRHQNSVDFLSELEQDIVDCFYLDPMFPAHKSTARPSKDLQILQLLTDNQNIIELFELALNVARYRVVVKRPLHAPALNERKPDIVYKEKTIRFDVYLTNRR